VNLFKAELHRLLSRRFVQILTGIMIAAFGITVGVTMAGSHQPTAAEWAQATAQVQESKQTYRQLYDECVVAYRPDASAIERARFPEGCSFTEAHAEDFLWGTYVFHTSIRPLLGFLTAYLALFGFLVGATFIGAELSSGGATNLLLWRPQRTTVLATKLGVLLLAVGAFSVAFSAVYVGTFYGIAQATGYVGSVDADFMSDLALLIGRGLLLALIVTAISFGVATLGRHTAASLGLLTAYAVVWEGGARIIMQVLNTNMPDPWFLSTYVGAWMTGRIELYAHSGGTCMGYGNALFCSHQYAIYWWHAALVFIAALAVLVGGAFVSFRRRDLA
jgi:ABC-type transport system involved in multi-copper enzyme maturation permease subunit